MTYGEYAERLRPMIVGTPAYSKTGTMGSGLPGIELFNLLYRAAHQVGRSIRWPRLITNYTWRASYGRQSYDAMPTLCSNGIAYNDLIESIYLINGDTSRKLPLYETAEADGLYPQWRARGQNGEPRAAIIIPWQDGRILDLHPIPETDTNLQIEYIRSPNKPVNEKICIWDYSNYNVYEAVLYTAASMAWDMVPTQNGVALSNKFRQQAAGLLGLESAQQNLSTLAINPFMRGYTRGKV